MFLASVNGFHGGELYLFDVLELLMGREQTCVVHRRVSPSECPGVCTLSGTFGLMCGKMNGCTMNLVPMLTCLGTHNLMCGTIVSACYESLH